MAVYDITVNQFNLVYDFLSFSLACMAATTIFVWMRVVRSFMDIIYFVGVGTYLPTYTRTQ
jgi:hypothetical protein